MPLNRPLALVAAAAALALTAACGSEDPSATTSPTSPSPTATPTATEGETTPTEAPAKTEKIVFEGGDVTPAGKKVTLAPGETLTLEITAEEPGELHVHSSPEQAIEFPAGESSHEITIDRPGLVEVEAHHPHKLVLQLQVS